MSRVLTFAILGVLIVILGVMSYVVEQAGKPEPPKKPSEQEAHQHQKEMEERMKKEAEARKKMLETIQKQQSQKSGGTGGSGKRPVNPTAPDPSKTKNTVPPGALDISEDWFRKRAPGETGIKQLEERAKQEQPAVAPPPPRLAPATPVR